jgi:hypothetical protein
MQNPVLQAEHARAEQVFSITARMSRALRDRLIARALENDQTLSAVIRVALRAHLDAADARDGGTGA